MRMVSYGNIVFPEEFCGVRDSKGGDYDKWPDYEALLDMMSREFLKDRYALCLQLKKDVEVVYEFPKVPSLSLVPILNCHSGNKPDIPAALLLLAIPPV
jgi:hypothetical protein